jgi:hypothetical protein
MYNLTVRLPAQVLALLCQQKSMPDTASILSLVTQLLFFPELFVVKPALLHL